ncbi:helix-turn-helix domain-containing protein [Halalkalibacter krulwichiae]|uniref:Uncharacterized protein n=1 Tax=Halalkalibacter krulwichiae TaxID=199441 RepID=A0A1X9MH07_9BACI|nr:helix-turn-helix domain-containing protein [Halalkalibacter krulwichiae]ARK30781.1 hypothetical protein BkAM31D_13570 [Halalkalibacter krulwichiae]
MLKDNQLKAIRMYYEGMHTVQQIAEECGYADRKSIYNLLKKPEAQEYIDSLATESLHDALNTFKVSSKKLSKELVKMANGEIKDNKTVYARLQAIQSILEKAGLNSKTLIIEDKKSNDEDYNELMDMLKDKKEEE